MSKIAGIVIVIAAIAGVSYWALNGNKSSQYIEVNRDLSEESESPEHEETGFEDEHAVVHTEQGFSPATLTVTAGEEVTFKNESAKKMWPASNTHPTHLIYPEFDAKSAIASEGAYKFKFTKKGTWPYHDHLEPVHQGTIIVK